ncbi:hypothetical protein [Nocardiopsis halotolerans]|uniref:hypothetical protein n=1 Tax=Nocardiopsis halotolerans TaxID=124252 RepID=UPI0003453279|nr:hypothetical protein [Nocardiopsis halotolerans]
MDTDAPGPSGPELREYTAVLPRRWRLLGAGVLGGLALASAAVIGLPATHTSVAAVQVRPSGMAEFTGERSGRLAGEVNLDTEAQILMSDRVSSAVAEALPGDGPGAEELRERVDVSVPPNSSVLEISYSAPDPEAARAGAQAYADVYLKLRRTGIDDLIGDHLEALRGEQEARYEDLAEAAAEGTPGGDARVDALRAEITELGDAITPLSALAETVDPGRVITPADLPEDASSPRPVLWLVGGAALGLLTGLLAAVVRDRLDPRLHGTEDTARIGAVPVLLDLSERARRGVRSPGLLSDDDLLGQRVHEFTHLVRARLAAGAASDEVTEPEAEGSGSGRVLLVAATTPGRAGTATAVNLAAALARTGSETLLVCTDPRTDTIGELLGLPEGPGLAEALLEGEDPASLEVRPDVAPRLRVLRYGSPGMNAPVQDTATSELVRLLRAGAEYVVVAAAPVRERADVHALAGTADLLLPVVELGRTRGADLTGLLVLADRFGVPVPGTAVLPRQPLAGPAPVASPSAGGPSGPGRGSEVPAGTDGDRETAEAEEPAKARGASGIALTGIVSDVPVAAGTPGTKGAGTAARPRATDTDGTDGDTGGAAEAAGDARVPGGGEIPVDFEVPRVLGSDGATEIPVTPEGTGDAAAAEARKAFGLTEAAEEVHGSGATVSSSEAAEALVAFAESPEDSSTDGDDGDPSATDASSEARR